MTFEPVRQYGVSLFASAGVAGLVVGLAARPVLSNLIAGIQLAVTQPIRIEDAVVIENESGRIEEITSTYVVVRLWDMRRMIVPLTYFIEKPFQNWTRESANQISAVHVNVDYTTPVDRVRQKAEEIVKASPLWDGNLVKLHVTESDAQSMQLRVIASARSSGDAFELRCEIREKLIGFPAVGTAASATAPAPANVNAAGPGQGHSATAKRALRRPNPLPYAALTPRTRPKIQASSRGDVHDDPHAHVVGHAGTGRGAVRGTGRRADLPHQDRDDRRAARRRHRHGYGGAALRREAAGGARPPGRGREPARRGARDRRGGDCDRGT